MTAQFKDNRWEGELFRLLVTTTKDYAVFVIDLEGRILTWNLGAQRVLGYNEEEMVGQPVAVTFTLEDCAQGIPESELKTAIREGRAVDDRWHQKKDGTRLWVSGVMVLLRDEAGTPQAFAKIMRDFTETKLATDALRESEERLRVALAAAQMGTWIWRIPTDEQLLDANLCRLMGLSCGDANMPIEQFLSLIHADDRPPVRDAFERGRRECGEFQVDFRVTWPDESVHWIRDKGKGFPAADGRPLFLAGACVDVTAPKRNEEALREADRRKDDFIATLAHELRNPLAPLHNGLQVVRMSPDRTQRERAQAVMGRQIAQLIRLVDDLLDMNRITRDRLELRRERVALADVVASAVETVRPMIDAAGHELKVDLPSEPVYLEADPVRLAQVFGNLLTNSAKYTERGGRIWLSAERCGEEVAVWVRDTGIGIPADALPHIFGMFTQVDSNLEQSASGLGIGLAVVKSLVEMHGGTVVAQSTGPGGGSTFTVRLPLPPERSAPRESIRPGEGISRGGCRVLVADDNHDSAESMMMMLDLLGDEVMTAHDGLEAVEMAERFQPDVVLMDLGMPRMNGYEATRRIRAQPWGQTMKVIALSGWGQEEDRLRSREAGCDGHLVKPVSLSELQKLLGDLGER